MWYSGVSVDCPFDIDNSFNTMLVFPYYRPYVFGLGMGECFCVGYESNNTTCLNIIHYSRRHCNILSV